MKRITLKVKSIEYTGSSVGQEISLKGSINGNKFTVPEKRIPKLTRKKYDQIVASLVVKNDISNVSILLTIVERDSVWNDQGTSKTEIQIIENGVKEFLMPVTVIEKWWLFLKKKAIFLVSLEIETRDNESKTDIDYIIQEYSYKGVSGDEDYNKYDEIIKNVVKYWNSQFATDTNPPSALLDPNLVKAICYQESRIGNDSRAEVDIMQVGYPDNPAIKTLQGKLSEYWLHNDVVQTLSYPEAKVVSVYDSVYWGVRWLYHKAQGLDESNQRFWRSWQAAVKRYGSGTEKYADDIWKIYTDGVKKEKNNTVRLWSLFIISLLGVGFFGSNYFSDHLQQARVYHVVTESQKEIVNSPFDNDLRAVIEVSDQDWWELLSLYVGENEVPLFELPSEQSIYSARLIRIGDSSADFLEVYGVTHDGHGNFYLYEISNQQAILKIKEVAVDTNPDIRFSPENKEKYGYVNCGEVFENDTLRSDYSSDIALYGTQLILCESLENPDQLLEVDRTPVKKLFTI